MPTKSKTLLAVGATGSIGRLVVERALQDGYGVRAPVRSQSSATPLSPEAEVVVGDVYQARDTGKGIDALVFTLGSDDQGKAGAEAIDYGGVRNILAALGPRPVRIALMTAIGVTDRNGRYNRTTQAHDWKRRSERLVRASGLPYTIVRPAGSTTVLRISNASPCCRETGGMPAIRATASSRAARSPRCSCPVSRQTRHASRPLNWWPRRALQRHAWRNFADLDPDVPGALDAVRDLDNMPIEREPAQVRSDLAGSP
jgi:hypothetical protein